MVIAKEPVPGRVKTRLTPAYTPAEAAELAEAALADTLAAVASAGVTRRVLALAGTPGRWLPPGFDVIAQHGGGLDERLAWALADARATCPAPLVFIGMDTPQVTPALLAQAVEPLVSGTADATFGMAEDGGFWLLGLREIDPALVLGVPMSRSDTGALQLARLHRGRAPGPPAARTGRRRHRRRGRADRGGRAGFPLRGLRAGAGPPGRPAAGGRGLNRRITVISAGWDYGSS